jgi:hypothetical protein
MESIVEQLDFGSTSNFDTLVWILEDRMCKQLRFHLISYLLLFVKAKRVVCDLAMSIQERSC